MVCYIVEVMLIRGCAMNPPLLKKKISLLVCFERLLVFYLVQEEYGDPPSYPSLAKSLDLA